MSLNKIVSNPKEDKHRPNYIRCTCGELVPWGQFDEHHKEALLNDFKERIARDIKKGNENE